jgi:hypothetical protein
MTLGVLPQRCFDPRLIALATTPEPLQQIGVQPKRSQTLHRTIQRASDRALPVRTSGLSEVSIALSGMAATEFSAAHSFAVSFLTIAIFECFVASRTLMTRPGASSSGHV